MIELGAKLLTIKEVLEIAGVSRFTLYKDIKSGKVPAVHFGKNVRIKESDALAYAEAKGNGKRFANNKNKDE